jgi:hypothetical protein
MQIPLEFDFRVHISNLNKLMHTVFKGHKRIKSIRRLHTPRYCLSLIATPSTAALPHKKLRPSRHAVTARVLKTAIKEGAMYNPF